LKVVTDKYGAAEDAHDVRVARSLTLHYGNGLNAAHNSDAISQRGG
jgi:hypothetical protein